jgi:hypothetical protein
VQFGRVFGGACGGLINRSRTFLGFNIGTAVVHGPFEFEFKLMRTFKFYLFNKILDFLRR